MNEGEVFELSDEDLVYRGEVILTTARDLYRRGLSHASHMSPRYNESDFISVRTISGWDKVGQWLTTVDVRNNELTSLGDMSSATGLRTLGCSCNRITTLGDLSPFTRLQWLDCSVNELQGELVGLSRLRSLTQLFCSRNELTTLDGLYHCTQLHTLECFENPYLASLPDMRHHRELFRVRTGATPMLDPSISVDVIEDRQVARRFRMITWLVKCELNCRKGVVAVLHVANVRRAIRDVLGLVARAVWATKENEAWG